MGCGRVAVLVRRSLGGHIDLVDRSMIVVAMVVRAMRGHMAVSVCIRPRRHTLALGFALANLVCSRLVAHKAFRTAVRDLCVDCGVVRHLRVVLARSLGCSRTRPLTAI
jgi:hypothetical protein